MLLGTSGGRDRSGQTERRTVVGPTAFGVVFCCPQSSTTQARFAVHWHRDHRVDALVVGQHAQRGLTLFPLLTGIFGLGHWTEIQSANWEAAHTGGGSLAALWTEWLAYRSFGHWQWSLTPWLVVVGLGMAPKSDRIKDGLAVGMGLAVFVLLTHAQSRFLIPMLPLFALIAARPLSRLPQGLIWVMLLVPMATFLGQRQGLPTAAFGQARFWMADRPSQILRRAYGGSSVAP